MNDSTIIDAPSGKNTNINGSHQYRDYVISVGLDPDNSTNPITNPATTGTVQLEVVPFGFGTATNLADPVFDLSKNQPICYQISGAFVSFTFKPSAKVDGNYRISVVS